MRQQEDKEPRTSLSPSRKKSTYFFDFKKLRLFWGEVADESAEVKRGKQTLD